jgi:hypothetical protein
VNLPRADRDPISEAINRDDWVDYYGFGTVDDRVVIVVGELQEETPTLSVYVGVTFDTVTVTLKDGEQWYFQPYGRVNQLHEEIEQLREKYDLTPLREVVDGDDWELTITDTMEDDSDA